MPTAYAALNNMLTVLYGPSCVGKTTIIRHLIEKHNWRPISCYLTRDIRLSDINRIQVTKEKFTELCDEGAFHCVNHHFETSYGTPKVELFNAVDCCKNRYILDFMIKNSYQLDDIKHKKIIIIPESLEKFQRQIESSGRSDRAENIFRDLDENYNEEKIKEYNKLGFNTIINRFDDIDSTLKTFLGNT